MAQTFRTTAITAIPIKSIVPAVDMDTSSAHQREAPVKVQSGRVKIS